MQARRKRLRVFSISGLLVFVMFLTFLNISWKTDRDSKINISKVQEVQIDSASHIVNNNVLLSNYINDIYNRAGLENTGLSEKVFKKAITGFLNLKKDLNQNKQILTVVDFAKASTEKRMWIIDLENQKLLLNTYVAHGQGSGFDMANQFSNQEESHQSSLGFYITNETYVGKHGLSLKLDGQDLGINDKARNRAIVVHGATYVSEQFIKQTGRLGRSFGCPAVPEELNNTIIELIKGKTCLFINGKGEYYQSALLNDENLISALPTFKNS
jgi:hypothetical protein